eukprot:737815-Ditylum_brightwellii.AAC.1
MSSSLSPRVIVTSKQPDYGKHCKIPFRAYLEIHNKPDPSKYMTPRMPGTVSLKVEGNLQGDNKFLNLKTDQKISNITFTGLLISTDVVGQVKNMAANTGVEVKLEFGGKIFL